MVFEDIIQKEWPKVKEKFIPKVGAVSVVEGKTLEFGRLKMPIPTAAYSPFIKKIVINPDFVKRISKDSGLTIEETIRALLYHEIGHERYFQMGAKAQIVLGTFGQEKFPEIPKFDNIYADVEDNLKNILCGTGEEIRKLMKGMAKESNAMELLHCYYELQATGIDIKKGDMDKKENKEKLAEAFKKVGAKEYFTPYLERLVGIPFIQEDGRIYKNSAPDKESLELHKSLMLRFGFVLQDFLKDPKTQQQQQQKGGKGKGVPCQGGDLGDIVPSEKEIRDAMNEIAKEGSKGDYAKAKKFIKDKFGLDLDKEEQAMAKAIGVGGGNFEYHPEAIPYHLEIARGLPLYIKKKPMMADDEDAYPDNLLEFQIGDPVKRLNLANSCGKIMPELTQRFEEEEGKTTLDLKVPHGMFFLDCSGSMPSIMGKSVPLICTYSLVLNYHQNGSHLGGIVFGGDTYIHGFSRDLMSIIRHFSIYDGGGTTIDFEKVKQLMPFNKIKPDFDLKNASEEEVKKFLKETGQYEKALKKEVTIKSEGLVLDDLNNLDIYVITDGGIYNLGETLNYLHSYAKKARTTILHVGSMMEINESSFPENVSLIKIGEDYDKLMKITFGLLKQEFGHE